MLFASITKSLNLFNVQQPSVSVVINNSNSPAGPGWFSSAISSIRAFADAHPYITYVVVGAAAGVVVYFAGVAFVGRVIQSNANLRTEMEATRNSMNEVQDALIDVKLELARGHANSLVELSQQSAATDLVVRETAELLVAVNTNVLGIYESLTQLAACLGHAS
jgi:hypothetical protein